MAGAHRIDDVRSCGAVTVPTGNSTVFVNDKLRAVHGDLNSHGGGALIATGTTVFIEDKLVIVAGDHASADSADHPDPAAVGFSPNVETY